MQNNCDFKGTLLCRLVNWKQQESQSRQNLVTQRKYETERNREKELGRGKYIFIG